MLMLAGYYCNDSSVYTFTTKGKVPDLMPAGDTASGGGGMNKQAADRSFSNQSTFTCIFFFDGTDAAGMELTGLNCSDFKNGVKNQTSNDPKH